MDPVKQCIEHRISQPSHLCWGEGRRHWRWHAALWFRFFLWRPRHIYHNNVFDLLPLYIYNNDNHNDDDNNNNIIYNIYIYTSISNAFYYNMNICHCRSMPTVPRSKLSWMQLTCSAEASHGTGGATLSVACGLAMTGSQRFPRK